MRFGNRRLTRMFGDRQPASESELSPSARGPQEGRPEAPRPRPYVSDTANGIRTHALFPLRLTTIDDAIVPVDPSKSRSIVGIPPTGFESVSHWRAPLPHEAQARVPSSLASSFLAAAAGV